MNTSLIIFFLISCNSTPSKVKKNKNLEISDPNNCACIEVFQPVCYKEKTYSNACHAICAGAKEDELISGECL